MEANLEKSWFWGQRGLSSNPSITPEFIKAHLDKKWWWGASGLSSNTFKKTNQFSYTNNKQCLIL